MEPIPFVDLQAQYESISEDIDEAVLGVLRNGHFILGPHVGAFEREFADYVGSPHCIACGNGSDALEIVWQAWGIGPGDEVVVPANTWITSASSASRLGATPVFVDTHPDFYGIDPEAIEAKITPRTRAIVAVHLYGLPAEMDAITEIARRHDLKVLEDCAQGHGATYHGRHVGTIGDAGTFSFYPGKSLGAYGDGGAIVTSDSEVASLARRIGNHGQEVKDDHRMEGRNSRLDEVQAAVLRIKLRHLDPWIERRRAWAEEYLTRLASLPIQLPLWPEHVAHGWHVFAIQLDDRDRIYGELREQGIEVNIHYPEALPLVPVYAARGYTADQFPVAARQTKRLLSLPLYPELNVELLKRVCNALASCLRSV